MSRNAFLSGNVDLAQMKKFLPFLVVLAGLALILAGGGVLYFNQLVASPGVVPLPPSIATLPLTAVSEGRQALNEFERLHRQEFPLVGGAVGTYGVNQEAKIWVAESPLSLLARKMVIDMETKIAQGNSPFIPSGEFEDGGHVVYQLDGMGQRHFYFQADKLIIWLAADLSIAEQAIQEIMEFYP